MKKILILFIGVVLTVSVLSGCGSRKAGTSASSTPVAGPNVNSYTALTRSRPPIVNSAAFKKHGSLAFVYNGLLYDLDGSTGRVRQLTKSGEALHPVWSHDGQWLAFIRVTDSQAMTGPLCLVRRDGTQAYQVRRLPGPVTARSFAWSPAADELAVSQKDGLWLVPVQGAPTRLVDTKGAPNFLWSPDGKYLAYSVTLPSHGGQAPVGVLYTVAAAGGKPVRQLVAPAYCGIQLAAWWPDGQGLLYWLDPDFSASLQADGLHLWSLRLGETMPKSLGTALTYRDWLSFTPQGRLLMVNGDGRGVWTNKELSVFDVATGKSENLPNPAGKVALDPAFSPDGKRIAFVAARDLGGFDDNNDNDQRVAWVASRTLWIENAHGSGAHPLPSAGPGVYHPAWSRDGKSITYVRDNALWMISAGGGTPQRILELSPTPKNLFGYYGYVSYDNFSWFQPPSG